MKETWANRRSEESSIQGRLTADCGKPFCVTTDSVVIFPLRMRYPLSCYHVIDCFGCGCWCLSPVVVPWSLAQLAVSQTDSDLGLDHRATWVWFAAIAVAVADTGGTRGESVQLRTDTGNVGCSALSVQPLGEDKPAASQVRAGLLGVGDGRSGRRKRNLAMTSNAPRRSSAGQFDTEGVAPLLVRNDTEEEDHEDDGYAKLVQVVTEDGTRVTRCESIDDTVESSRRGLVRASACASLRLASCLGSRRA